MPKRRRESESEEIFTPSKRSRAYYAADRLSFLSDEIVLRILSYLSVSSLGRCQRVSQRFNTLSSDSEVWKEKYYARFVRPRALRIPGINTSPHALLYSSKLSKWLDEDHLVRKGRETDWKAQYRLRHNWSNGSCKVEELEVGQNSVPQALVKYHQGLVVTLNEEHDLRVWRMKDGAFLGEVRSVEQLSTPTSLAIDNGTDENDHMTLAVGYEDGSFRMFDMQISTGKFSKLYSHAPSSNGSISSIASTFPYLLTLSCHKTLSLYRFSYYDDGNKKDTEASNHDKRGTKFTQIRSSTAALPDPELLSSLLSTHTYSPSTLSLRLSPLGVIASIAYCYTRFRIGSNIGLQELLINTSASDIPIASSRLATTPDWTERTSSIRHDYDFDTVLSPRSDPLNANRPQATILMQPTSLSYSHPYLLVSYPDNTLKAYQVSSTAEGLSIGSGRRLWGHTSSVSGAQVSDRGKAVSVSCKGNDIRIWELEDALLRASPTSTAKTPSQSSSTSPVNSVTGWQPRASVQLQPQRPSIPSSTSTQSPVTPPAREEPEIRWGDLPLTPSPSPSKSDTTGMVTAGGWIAFDDHRVIVLNDRDKGGQFVSCYDFS